MRIVGGRLRGKPLAAPGSSAIRPTSDRLREAIFNILIHGQGDSVSGARVLDLFAGTGAMGFEALSRGAAFATFVEDGREAHGLLRRNVEALGLGDVTRLVRRDATAIGLAAAIPLADLVFCDPPYGRALAEAALASCRAGNWLADGAIVVIEEAADSRFALPGGFAETDRRRYGATEVTFGRLLPD